MKETVISLIENESENTKLDFKEEQYPIERGHIKKGEFLKDMCAFANLPGKEDKFIIIGVKEENGIAAGFKPIDKLHDQASYQQFLNQYIEPEIKFEYKELMHQGHRLAYFRLFGNDKAPYLFKQEYNDTQQRGNQYRPGTGFVRIGTSTRFLKRDDFEKIYAERTRIKDRSEDIDFDFKICWFTSPELRHAGHIKHLQIDISNASNASIDLDVEARIYNNRYLKARCAQDLEYKNYEESRSKSMWAFTADLDKMLPPFIYRDMNVEFNNRDAYSSYEITSPQKTEAALRVKQKGTVADIFNGQIALVFSRPAELKIELIVSSNDFPDGPKTFEYSFPEEEIQEFLDPMDL
ncbi:ATP-binding protein [Pedobacter sp. KR3-3]|uniref:ATP-binding protein n=1 Tax=Pedobacter albus TaxID=3113905 RepID=A0ABU7ICM2_9SPHI|nr:ATP-binding protein [Pedobacter sp. KR3-3]MEE1947243.1 ATP-binding protein [Pedobacter sp. KR3-3]